MIVYVHVCVCVCAHYVYAYWQGIGDLVNGFLAAICIFYGRCDSIATNSFNGPSTKQQQQQQRKGERRRKEGKARVGREGRGGERAKAAQRETQ